MFEKMNIPTDRRNVQILKQILPKISYFPYLPRRNIQCSQFNIKHIIFFLLYLRYNKTHK